MKNLLIISLVILLLTSCSKDSLDPVTDNFVFVDNSQVVVTVTYLTWSDLTCDLTCAGTGREYINYMQNAKVDLYSGTTPGTDDPNADRRFGTTNESGSVLFEDLDPGQYTIIVDTPLGQKTRTVYTQLNRRSSVEFSF